MLKKSIALTLAGLLAVAPAAALAMGNGHGRGNSKAASNAGGNGGGVVPAVQQTIAALTDIERSIIRNYFQTNYANLPPGLAKRQVLPPGLRRHIERNGTLPPGLQRNRLPEDLRVRLPGREDLEFLIIDDEVVLVAAATLIIIDVLFDVF